MQELKSIKRENSKKEKAKLKAHSGITLIALVITIIVLLILAGVTLAMLTGDSGILSNAQNAKEDTLEANAREKVQIAIMEHKIGKYSEGKTLKEYLEAAGATDVTGAGTKGKMDGYNFEIENGVVTITKPTTQVTGKLKLKDVYTEEMIGQEINYTTTNALPTDVKWIVIGQDKEGNVLATTNRPLGMAETEADYMFNVTFDAAHWLTYEEDLNAKCAELFAGSVQNQNVKVESMDLDHVNALTGFTEPTFNTYTFRDQTDNDYANKIVNYYHPDANGTVNEETGEVEIENWSKAETTYDCDAYYYRRTETGLEWFWEGTDSDWQKTEYTGILNNLDLVLGENNEFMYVLASRYVYVDSDYAGFDIGIVDGDGVYSGNYDFCFGDSSGFDDSGDSGAVPVRPVVYLSSEFLVEEQDDGTYKLAENV